MPPVDNAWLAEKNHPKSGVGLAASRPLKPAFAVSSAKPCFGNSVKCLGGSSPIQFRWNSRCLSEPTFGIDEEPSIAAADVEEARRGRERGGAEPSCPRQRFVSEAGPRTGG